MGSGRAFDDVSAARVAMREVRRVDSSVFARSEQAANGQVGIHPMLDIKNRRGGRAVCSSDEHPFPTPILPIMDLTESRGDDVKALYAALRAFLGSIVALDLVTSPQIGWLGVGDAKADDIPIQFSPFESDHRIDQWLQAMILSRRGGGSGEESYELAAYAAAHLLDYATVRQGRKGYAFFFADEAPYPTVSGYELRNVLGVNAAQDVPAEQAFADLRKVFHTFLIQPRSTAAQRRQSIDAELKARLDAQGGQYKNVDIRATIRWDNRDMNGGDYWDLDLHVVTPAGAHIYYANRKGPCQGFLDVDANAERLMVKPVENIRWADGLAPDGVYEFYIVPYSCHGKPHPVECYYEIERNGEIIASGTHTFQGHQRSEKDRHVIGTFRFGRGRSRQNVRDDFAAYDETLVRQKWTRYLPATNILQVQDAASGVEAMLGIIALQEGKMTLEEFIEVLNERGVPAERQEDVRLALKDFAHNGVIASAPAGLFV